MAESNDGEVAEVIGVGDIVTIDGYDGLTFEIISATSVYFKDRESEYTTIDYETLCREHGRNYFAEEGDVTLIEKQTKGGAAQREDNAETVDELLAELSDVSAMIDMFGEHEDDVRRDRRYALRKAEIIAKLKDITGGWSR